MDSCHTLSGAFSSFLEDHPQSENAFLEIDEAGVVSPVFL